MMKTNAMRILEQMEIQYMPHEYEATDGKVDGITVAGKIGKSEDVVFKTLVTKGISGEYKVFVIPVNMELDLKKAAKAAGEKSIQMIHVVDIVKITGYIRGGCSPIGMKKQFTTIIDEAAILQDTIVISAGKIGHQIEIKPDDLIKAVDAEYADITVN